MKYYTTKEVAELLGVTNRYIRNIPKRVFNTTGICDPAEHYMVDLTQRLSDVRKLVDDGKYFTINRARHIRPS